MRHTKAPLRRIAGRELVVFEYQHNSSHPRLFALEDRLECGHSQAVLALDFLDLINGYSDNPALSARRHRCQECAAVVNFKKPVVRAHEQQDEAGGTVSARLSIAAKAGAA